MSPKLFVTAAGAALMTAAVAACASSPLPYKTPATAEPTTAATGASPTSPTTPQTPLPPATGQLTGTQLQAVLLPQSSFPAGFSLSSSSAVSSGGSLETSAATYDPATMSCASYVNHLGNTGFGETAMASNSFDGQDQAFDQFVYQFGAADAAAKFIAGIQALAGRCHAFKAADGGSTGTFSLKATRGTPVGGHPSIEVQQTGTISGSPLTLDTLFTASGVDVFAAAAVGLGTTAPTSPATPTLIYSLMKRQAAAAVLG